MSKKNENGKQQGAKKGTLKRLLGYITSVKRGQFIIVVCSILIAAISQAVGTMKMRNLIDDVITPLIGQDNPDLSTLFSVLLTMGIAYTMVVVFTFVYSRLMINVTQATLKQVRDDMFVHMQKLPIKYFDTNATGDIMSCYTNDTDTLRQMISQSIPQLINSTVTICTTFIAMLILSPQLTVIIIIMMVIMIFIAKFVAGNSSRSFIMQQKAIGELDGYVEEMMSGQKVVKVFNHEKESKENFDKVNEKLCSASTRANSFANVLMPIMIQMGNLTYVIVAIIGALLAVSGRVPAITLGVLASFLTFTKSFMQPIGQISNQVNFVVMGLAGAERIFNLLDEPEETDEGTVTVVRTHEGKDGTITEAAEHTGTWAWKKPNADGSSTLVPLRGEVRFDHVNFGYNEDKVILKDMTLYAKPGQKIAFVGPTGAGKTTITNLINRFYDVQEGSITFDGIDVKDIKKRNLRHAMGIVLQDTHLFTGTVEENIRFGKLDATHDEVVAAAKLANADYFITHLPEGYDTVLTGDGANLSQGQKQLLAIARAAIADPPVLILDEATSSIDTITEQVVQAGMDELMKGRTVFVIAHRLSTIQNSQAIMVLENGVITERGDHDSLIAKKGKYYQLYTGAVELE